MVRVVSAPSNVLGIEHGINSLTSAAARNLAARTPLANDPESQKGRRQGLWCYERFTFQNFVKPGAKPESEALATALC